MSGKRWNLRERPRTSKKRRQETKLILCCEQNNSEENENNNMIDEVVFSNKDYFCYTRTKRSSKRKLKSIKLSKDLTNSQLSSKKDDLQSEIYEMERDFIFMPDNIDDNPDDVQEIIQDRIKALDLLTSGIQ